MVKSHSRGGCQHKGILKCAPNSSCPERAGKLGEVEQGQARGRQVPRCPLVGTTFEYGAFQPQRTRCQPQWQQVFLMWLWESHLQKGQAQGLQGPHGVASEDLEWNGTLQLNLHGRSSGLASSGLVSGLMFAGHLRHHPSPRPRDGPSPRGALGK